MPPQTQRAWSCDEISFAIRDWLLTFGRLPQPEDWQPGRASPGTARYGALRTDGRARWPSAKTVLRRFTTWDHACSHALVGDLRLVGLEPAITRVNVDEAVKALVDAVATEKVASFLENESIEPQTVAELAVAFAGQKIGIWNPIDGEPDVPPPLANHVPTTL